MLTQPTDLAALIDRMSKLEADMHALHEIMASMKNYREAARLDRAEFVANDPDSRRSALLTAMEHLQLTPWPIRVEQRWSRQAIASWFVIPVSILVNRNHRLRVYSGDGSPAITIRKTLQDLVTSGCGWEFTDSTMAHVRCEISGYRPYEASPEAWFHVAASFVAQQKPGTRVLSGSPVTSMLAKLHAPLDLLTYAGTMEDLGRRMWNLWRISLGEKLPDTVQDEQFRAIWRRIFASVVERAYLANGIIRGIQLPAGSDENGDVLYAYRKVSGQEPYDTPVGVVSEALAEALNPCFSRSKQAVQSAEPVIREALTVDCEAYDVDLGSRLSVLTSFKSAVGAGAPIDQYVNFCTRWLGHARRPTVAELTDAMEAWADGAEEAIAPLR